MAIPKMKMEPERMWGYVLADSDTVETLEGA